MAKTKEQKKEMLKNIGDRIKDSKALVISVFDKLTVAEDQELRRELRKENVDYQVVKKTLLKKSFEENKIDELPIDELNANISLASSRDEVAGAKVLCNFSNDREDFRVLGGLLNGLWFDSVKINELAKLPSKPELLAKTVATINAPVSGLVNVLAGNLRGLVNVLNSIKNNN